LAIPVDVKQGYSMGIFKVDYRGYVHVSDNGGNEKATFEAEYFFAGVKGPKVENQYKTSDDVYIDDEVGAAVFTDCGEKTILRVNTSIMAKKDEDDDPDVEIGIDSTDVSVDYEFRYYLTQVQC